MEEVLAKYFSGNASSNERSEVIKYRDEFPGEFLSFKRAWADAGSFAPPKNGLDFLNQEKESKEVQMSPRPNWLKYAAAIIVLVSVGVAGYFGIFGSAETNAIEQVLADGTKVWLYKDSKLTDVKISDSERTVTATGKVFFDVERDELRPFTIITDEAVIQVLGTSFVVDASEENATSVAVTTGKVSFTYNPDFYDGKAAVIELLPGEVGVIDTNSKGIVKRENLDENYLAWVNQVMTFKKTELRQVAELIEEVYDYELIFMNEDLQNCQLSAKYEKKTPRQIARLIGNTFGFDYKINDKKQIIFEGEGCL
ncbi:MAG: FecR domain-containing protein [Cyclobacteriaceae bacterium]